ncbi:hypothetical protein GQR58_015003 [Nymphon striatum]|nr:hypothetical protein GQR58_015003 [Nymphon striatum]
MLSAFMDVKCGSFRLKLEKTSNINHLGKLLAMEDIFKILLVLLIFTKITKQAENNETKTTVLPIKSTVRTYRACVFDGKFYGHADHVDVKEPCLNCSCNQGLLACYRKACPPLAVRPECKLEKQPNICCPVIVCGNNTEEIMNEEVSNVQNSTDIVDIVNEVEENVSEERTNDTSIFDEDMTEFGDDEQIDGEATSGDEYHSTTSTPTTMDPFDEPIYKNIIRESRKQNEDDFNMIFVTENSVHMPRQLPEKACYHRGSIFSEGSAMESDELCQICFCLGGNRRCMTSECSLEIIGCIPEYDLHNPCCPKNYNCSDRVYKPNPCEICYCTASGIDCDNLICNRSKDNSCTPVMEEGECCPVAYNCSDHGDGLGFKMEISQDTSTAIHGLVENTSEGTDAFDETGPTMKDEETENTTDQHFETNETFSETNKGNEKMSASMLSTIIRDIKYNLSQLVKDFYGRNTNSSDSSRPKNDTDSQSIKYGHDERDDESPSQGETNTDDSMGISLKSGDVNDTVMALLLEHVFGSNNENAVDIFEKADFINETAVSKSDELSKSSENITKSQDFASNEKNKTNEINAEKTDDKKISSSDIRPAFLPASYIEEITNRNAITDNTNKVPNENENNGSEIITPTTEPRQHHPSETTINPAEADKYNPQFIDSSLLSGAEYTPENDNGFSDRILEEPARKPVRENDRLINILDMNQVLEQQFDLGKLPPHLLLSKMKSRPKKPIYKKPNKKSSQISFKNKPAGIFGPPPTLPPQLVASLLSMFKPTQYVNNRVNRGDVLAEVRYPKYSATEDEVVQSGRKESSQEETPQNKPDIKFIPFVAADAVGHEGNSEWKNKEKPSAEDILEYMTAKAHQCKVGDKIFENGVTVPRADGCVECRCLYGQILCKEEICSPPLPGCTSVQMEGDCCPVQSCGDGLVEVVNKKNYQQNKEKPTTEKPSNEKNMTDDRFVNFDSVFTVIDRENVSSTNENPFKEESTQFRPSGFKNKAATSAPTTLPVQSQNSSSDENNAEIVLDKKSEMKTTLQPPNLDSNRNDSNGMKNEQLQKPENDEQGTYVASVDVIPIGKKPSRQDIQVGSSTNNEQDYNVGSVLHFGVDEDQKIIENGGIITSATRPDFNPYDILSDLFVPENENKEQNNNNKKVVKDWSTSIQQGSSPEIQFRHTTQKPDTFRTDTSNRQSETTKKPTRRPTTPTTTPTTTRRPTTSTTPTTTRRSTTPKPTSRFTKTTKQPKPPKTTVQFRKPVVTTTRKTTTTTTTTNKPFIDIAKPTVAGNFLDPWGLLKLSGCSYNGKTYMVGADIPELGNRCKICSCSSVGVVCQELNC